MPLPLPKRLRSWLLDLLGPDTPTSGASATSREPRILVNPMALSGQEGLETDVLYVSRWGLVEFGVKCPRCGEPAARKGDFHKVYSTNLGDAIDCPGRECRGILIASPVTEYAEHKLPQTPELKTFAKARHPQSPLSQMEAHTARVKNVKVAVFGGDGNFDALTYVAKQASMDKEHALHLMATQPPPEPTQVPTSAEVQAINVPQTSFEPISTLEQSRG